MIRRLVEANYFGNQTRPTAPQIAFWIQELRTPDLLMDLAKARSSAARRAAKIRPLILHALAGDSVSLSAALEEERRERATDQEYWLPLKKELEKMRRGR